MSPVLVHLGAQFTCQCIGLSMVGVSGDVLAVSEGTSEGRHIGLQDGRHTFVVTQNQIRNGKPLHKVFKYKSADWYNIKYRWLLLYSP